MSTFLGEDRLNSLTLTAETNKVLQSKWRTNFGAEIGLLEIVFLRAGFLEKEGNISGMTYGGGIRIGNYRFDYANVPSSKMIGYERIDKISLIFSF